MNRMMIDIECLSLKTNALVLQIGLCVFDFTAQQYVLEPMNLDLDPYEQKERDVDYETILWWTSQPEQVRRSVLDVPSTARVSRAYAKGYVEAAMVKYAVAEVWAAPVGYDLAVLTSLWNGNKPWNYQQEMDMSTLYRMFERAGRDVQGPTLSNVMQHNAAADAHWQMEYLRLLLKALDIA